MRGGDKQKYLFEPPTSKRTKQPGGGEMETGRGKRGKKWQLSLGVKDTIFAAIGIVGLMMISFALGALAGRGDIYRAAYSWGLMNPESKPVAQVIPPLVPAPAPQAAATPAPAAVAAAAPAPPAATTAAVPHPAPHKKKTVTAKAGRHTPIIGSITPLPAPATTASPRRRSRAAQVQHERKLREAKLLKERMEVARKLTFLNSLDSPKAKKSKDRSKTSAAKSQPATQVKVATYRSSKTAKAKLAELQKHGVKVTLKQGKDNKGVYYTVYRQAPAAHSKTSPKLAQRKEKTGSTAKRH
jgi:hypothetical protein